MGEGGSANVPHRMRICNAVMPVHCISPPQRLMPNPATDLRHLSFLIPAHQLEHLDQRAAYLGCSRSDYIRRLFIEDLERQQSTAAQG